MNYILICWYFNYLVIFNIFLDYYGETALAILIMKSANPGIFLAPNSLMSTT